MAITPHTDLRLIKCPLELDNKNVLKFASKQAQETYFLSLPHLEIEDITYQRKDSTIRYPAHIDSIIEYNYCMYKNENYTDKYFYAYITGMRYINDNMTEITIKTDVFTTWQFDLNYKRSFIEREHVNDDTIGLHTVPENLETGEYISTNLQPTLTDNLETCFCLAASENLFQGYSTLSEILPTGLYYFGLTSLQGIKDLIKLYEDAGKADEVYSVFVIPKEFFYDWTTATGITGQISKSIRFSTNVIEININKPTYLGQTYVPRNNKLLTFPYSFLQVSNHNGSIVNYNWEEFGHILDEDTCTFLLRGAFSIGGSFSAYPRDYKNIFNNYDEGITLGKFPVGGWQSDVFTNWLTQNGVNIGLSIAGSAVSIVGGIALAGTGAGALQGSSSALSGALGIAQTLGSVYEHSLAPFQAKGNTNVGDYSFTFGLTNLEFKRISIKNEYSAIIDNYFSMYGYKVNITKIPNITGRRNWNYVRTIGMNIEAYIPQEDLQEIKNMFDSGVTIWHSASTFLDYSQDNSIL